VQFIHIETGVLVARLVEDADVVPLNEGDPLVVLEILDVPEAVAVVLEVLDGDDVLVAETD
jgi:hypothetical protein